MGSDESHFNVSVRSDGQSHGTVSTNHNFLEEKGEPKRYQAEVLPLTSLTPYRRAKLAHNSSWPVAQSYTTTEHAVTVIWACWWDTKQSRRNEVIILTEKPNRLKVKAGILPFSYKSTYKVHYKYNCKLGQGRNAWQWVKHTQLYSDLPQAFKGSTFVSSGFWTEGTLLFVSVASHCVRIVTMVLHCPASNICVSIGHAYFLNQHAKGIN